VTGVTRGGTLQRDDGPTIAYDVAGHGPLVVFVHGLTSFRQAWDPVTTLLAEEFRQAMTLAGCAHLAAAGSLRVTTRHGQARPGGKPR